MTWDWQPDAIEKLCEERFPEQKLSWEWVFNSNWMDWNLRRNGARATVSYTNDDLYTWSIYKREEGVEERNEKLLKKGKEKEELEALLLAEEAIEDYQESSTGYRWVKVNYKPHWVVLKIEENGTKHIIYDPIYPHDQFIEKIGPETSKYE